MSLKLIVLSPGSRFVFTNSNYNYDYTNTNSSSHLCDISDIDPGNKPKKHGYDLKSVGTGHGKTIF
jgi:hypothetical protein